MVVFSCDGCGEMLKKSQVDSHARKCYNCASVSCVDCSVSFWGDDYRKHTSCITEAERYEKTVYKGPKKNDTSKRKLTPQEIWISIINESLHSCPPNLTRHIETIVSYENVPRKEKAFRNFASNSLKLYGHGGDATIASLWNHFNAIRQKRAEEKEASSKGNKDSDKCTEKDEAKDSEQQTSDEKINSKSQDEAEQGDTVCPSLPLPEKKAVSKLMRKALKKSPKHQLKLKELHKMIKGDTIFKDSIRGGKEWEKIIKDSVLSNKNLKLEGKRVTLIIKN